MPTVRYTVIDSEVIAEKRSGVRRQYIPDPLGSTIALLDSTQAKTDTFTYWPYGEESNRTGTTATPFRYVGTLGYYRDSATKNYVRERYIEAKLGRWVTEDPIRFLSGDYNLYRYVTNSPSVFVDFFGTFKVINCSSKTAQRIKEQFDNACNRAEKFARCIYKCCPDVKPPKPEQPSCIQALCTNPNLVFRCKSALASDCTPYHPSVPDLKPCARTVNGSYIVICPPFEGTQCGNCTVIHELIHACGQLGHPKPCFACVQTTFYETLHCS